MRFFAFLFLAAFLVSGLIRYSRAESPPVAPAQIAAEAPRPSVAPTRPAAAQVPATAPAQAEPEPQVLRHKRRYARAALRAIQKMPGREPPLPPRRMAKAEKAPARR